jgi:hypothetical protein
LTGRVHVDIKKWMMGEPCGDVKVTVPTSEPKGCTVEIFILIEFKKSGFMR